MATIIRVGLIAGGIAFVLLFALQSHMGLAVAPGITLAGVAAGLGMAKWLDRAWYGRQLEAGVRAGLLASGFAAAGVLASLIALGPHSVTGLARLSHGPAYDLGPFIQTISFAGWIGAGIVFIVATLAAGVLASATMAQIFGWSKSTRVTRVITQARLAAQALNHDDGWRRTTAGPALGQQAHTSALLAQLQGAPHSGSPIASGVSATGLATPMAFGANTPSPAGGVMPPADMGSHAWSPARDGAPARGAKKKAQPKAQPQEPAASAARQAPQPQPPAEPRQPQPRPAARDIDRASTEELKAAFEAWDQNQRDDQSPGRTGDAAEQDGPGSRIPTDSAYLNSVRPTPVKRNRKKQATRDWLC